MRFIAVSAEVSQSFPPSCVEMRSEGLIVRNPCWVNIF